MMVISCAKALSRRALVPTLASLAIGAAVVISCAKALSRRALAPTLASLAIGAAAVISCTEAPPLRDPRSHRGRRYPWWKRWRPPGRGRR